MDKIIHDAFFGLVRQVLGTEQVNKELIDTLSEDDWKELYRFARSQDLVQLIGDVIVREKLAPVGPIADSFRKETMQAAFRYEWLKKGLNDIRTAFDKENIPYIALKGVVVRDFYPSPWMRLSGDIDLLVKNEDFSRADMFCRECLGYRYDHESPHDISLETDNGVHLELHHSLLEENRIDDALRVLDRFWDETKPVPGSCEYVSTDEMYYFYHIVHMGKHFNGGGGCGVRPFIDLWLLNNKLPSNPRRAELITEGGLSSFEKVARELGAYWIEGVEPSELALRTEAYTLSGCLNGGEKNSLLVRQAKKGGRAKYFISLFFASYESLCIKYPSLKGKKWLTPVYRIKRICFGVKNIGIKRGVNEVIGVSRTSASEIEETKQLLDDLGL